MLLRNSSIRKGQWKRAGIYFFLVLLLAVIVFVVVMRGCSKGQVLQVIHLPNGWKAQICGEWMYDSSCPRFWLVLSAPDGRVVEESASLSVICGVGDSLDDFAEDRIVFGIFQSSSGRYVGVSQPGMPTCILAVIDVMDHKLWPRYFEEGWDIDSERETQDYQRKDARRLWAIDLEIRKSFGGNAISYGPTLALELNTALICPPQEPLSSSKTPSGLIEGENEVED